MSRRKVKLAYITNNSVRKATYNKRRSGFLKKLRDLSTLCDVDTCVILYSQPQANPDVQPSPDEVQRIVDRFTSIEETNQAKKMFDMETYLRQCIDKAGEQLKRLQVQNRRREMTGIMFEAFGFPMILEGMGMRQLNELNLLIEQYSLSVHKQNERLSESRAKEEERALAEATTTMAMTSTADCWFD